MRPPDRPGVAIEYLVLTTLDSERKHRSKPAISRNAATTRSLQDLNAFDRLRSLTIAQRSVDA